MAALRRRNALITAIIAAVVTTAAVGAFVNSRHDAGADAEPSHTPYIQLAEGTSDGAAWRLFGWEQQHQLCLAVLPAGHDPGHMPAAAPAAWEGGGCGFDDRHPGSGFTTSAAGPGGGISFGPLPAAATQIRVATHEVLATTPFPGGQGLPVGRFWISFTGPSGPAAEDGDILPNPQPLDAQGRPVAFQSF